MTTYAEAAALYPAESQRDDATGLFAPIIRAFGHILYVTAALAAAAENPDGYHLTEQETERELTHAAAHLARASAANSSAPLSTAAKNRISAFLVLATVCAIDYPEWDADDRGPRLRDLADRAASLAAYLDFELAGITGSDGGRSL